MSCFREVHYFPTAYSSTNYITWIERMRMNLSIGQFTGKLTWGGLNPHVVLLPWGTLLPHGVFSVLLPWGTLLPHGVFLNKLYCLNREDAYELIDRSIHWRINTRWIKSPRYIVLFPWGALIPHDYFFIVSYLFDWSGYHTARIQLSVEYA